MIKQLIYTWTSAPVNTELICSCMYSDIKRLSDLHDYKSMCLHFMKKRDRLLHYLNE